MTHWSCCWSPPQPDRRGRPVRVLQDAYPRVMRDKAQDLGTTQEARAQGTTRDAARRCYETASKRSSRMSMLSIALTNDARAARSSSVTGPARRSTSAGVTFWLSAMTLSSCAGLRRRAPRRAGSGRSRGAGPCRAVDRRPAASASAGSDVFGRAVSHPSCSELLLIRGQPVVGAHGQRFRDQCLGLSSA